MFAVGMPSSRPRLSPATTSPSKRNGPPRNFAAVATSPAATSPRMWLEEMVSPVASTRVATRVSNSSKLRRYSGVPFARLPKRKFSPPRPARRRAGRSARPGRTPRRAATANPLSNGITTSSSTPSPAIRSRFTGKVEISRGVASGRITDIGCGSNVRTVSAPPITSRWPRWTPSNVPMATRRGPEPGTTSGSEVTLMRARTLRRAATRHPVTRRTRWLRSCS